MNHDEESGPFIIDRDQATLQEWKQHKMNLVDKKTSELISVGFVYGGKTISTSTAAQMNLTVSDMKRNEIPFPLRFNTIDNLDILEITTAQDMDDFFMSGLAVVKGHYDSGTALKDLIRAAADKDAADAVNDNR